MSHTKASSSGTSSGATANAVELGGKPLASQFGGSTTGTGSASGDLFKLNPSSQLYLALTPWTAKSSQSSTSGSASGMADILVLDLGAPGSSQSASLNVLQSKSDSQWNATSSSGSGSTDGAILNLGGPSGLTVDLLHSETTSSGGPSGYLVSINGNQIGTTGQAAGKCQIMIPNLITVNCLTAAGGTGAVGTATAAVGKVALGSGSNKLTGTLFGTTSNRATSSAAPTQAPATAPAQAPAAPAAAPAASAPASSKLAFTGMNALAVVAAALMLILVGANAVALVHRRRLA